MPQVSEDGTFFRIVIADRVRHLAPQSLVPYDIHVGEVSLRTIILFNKPYRALWIVDIYSEKGRQIERGEIEWRRKRV
jgi:hypothetical protein